MTFETEENYNIWIAYLAIEGLESKLKENGIDKDMIMHVTDSVLKEIGVIKVGERIRILKSLDDLRTKEKTLDDLKLKERVEMLEKTISERDEKLSQVEKQLEDLKKLVVVSQKEKQQSTDSLKNYMEKSEIRRPSEEVPKTSKQMYRVYLDIENITSFACYKTVTLDPSSNCKELLIQSLKKFKFSDASLCSLYKLFLHWKGEEQLLNDSDNPLKVLDAFKKIAGNDEIFLVLRNVSSKHAQNLNIKKGEEKAIAILPYEASKTDELNLFFGRIVSIVNCSDANWWIVKDGTEIGWVPSNCLLLSKGGDVKLLEEPCSIKIIENHVPIQNNELIGTAGRLLTIYGSCDSWALAECQGFYGWIPLKSLEGDIISQVKRQSIKLITSLSLNNVNRRTISEASVGSSSKQNIMQDRRHSLVNFGEFLTKKANNISRLISKEMIESSIPSAINEESGNRLIQIFDALNEMESMLKSENSEIINQFETMQNSSVETSVKKEEEKTERASFLKNSFSFTSSTSSHGESAAPRNSTVRMKSNSVGASGAPIEKKSYGKKLNEILKDKFMKKMIDDDCLKVPSAACSMASSGSETSGTSGSNSGTTFSNIKKSGKKKQSLTGSLTSSFSFHGHKNNKVTDLSMSGYDLAKMFGESQFAMDSDFLLKGSNDSMEKARLQCEIIPYERLVEIFRNKSRTDIDYDKIEKYLSKEDCYEYLGVAKKELDYLPSWKIEQRKQKASLA